MDSGVVTRYKKITDVQATWREHGWTPPSEDPSVIEKWRYYRTLDTQRMASDAASESEVRV